MAKATARKVAPQKNAADELQDFFEDGLKDIYWAEKALVKALPKMQKNATSAQLKSAISSHLQETTGHVTRLEEVFQSIGKKAQAQKCDAMDGLLKEADGILKETKPGPVRDAAIIAAAQKVEHYEIATYGTLATYAKLLEHKTALNRLLQTLKEEKNCDTSLTKIAKTEINLKAV
ncbi:MAG TPA: ferritin-like domain-containing protein [Niabella sp.]